MLSVKEIAAAAKFARATERLALPRVLARVLKKSTTAEGRPSEVRPPAKKMKGGRDAEARVVRGTERLKLRDGGSDWVKKEGMLMKSRKRVKINGRSFMIVG